MSSGSLPDEIIREILAPVLKVPDEVFRNNAHVSPFSNYSESTSTILVVCKSWLRVSTPLLYNVVVLRSKAQAQALERTLRGNPFLGTFIKKLRVEGGYGSSMYHIIQASPNISELWLSMRLWSSDNVSGLCRGLPLINPTRLILHDNEFRPSDSNSCTRKLWDVLCPSIQSWDKLTNVDIPYHTALAAPRPNPMTNFLDSLGLLLAENPSLETLQIVTRPSDYNRFQARNWFKAHSDRMKVYLHTGRYDRVKKVVRYDGKGLFEEEEEEVPTDDSCSFSSSFVALQSASDDVKAQVWDNIVYFALLAVENEEPRRLHRTILLPLWPRAYTDMCSEQKKFILRCSICLVSKQFYSMALRHYYRHRVSDRVYLDLDRVQRNPTLPSAIHTYVTDPFTGASAGFLSPILSSATQLVHLISRRSPGRQVATIDYAGLVHLSKNVGSKLQTLIGQTVARPSSQKLPTPLYAFTALRVLEWDSSTHFKFEPKTVPIGALASLECLSFASSNDSFLRLLGCMTLPALRHVAFPTKKMAGAIEFLNIHGHKVRALDADNGTECWKLCPSLSVMCMLTNPIFKPHPNVEKIILERRLDREGNTHTEFACLGREDFPTLYPALKEIQVHMCRWPTNETRKA
ncbi:hypothetical protein H0H92_010298 [Tricholoma furcatifolium]|nr:hypothetical protein H0H92_010298 [Tricholoma furcatifolium]